MGPALGWPKSSLGVFPKSVQTRTNFLASPIHPKPPAPTEKVPLTTPKTCPQEQMMGKEAPTCLGTVYPYHLVQLLVDMGQLNKGAWWIPWDPDDDSGQEAPETDPDAFRGRGWLSTL